MTCTKYVHIYIKFIALTVHVNLMIIYPAFLKLPLTPYTKTTTNPLY